MGTFLPYNGNEPYIFVSYAHKDYFLVEQFLKCFSENKYRFWYDEGIKSGSEWSGFIVERIDKAEAFVVFLSANAIVSENVKDEIHVAVSTKKHVVVIKLDDTVLSGGLLLKLDRKQAIIFTGDVESSFKKLTSINQINNCVEISASEIFITYPNYDESAAFSVATGIQDFLKQYKQDVHIDQRAKIENVLDFELENGRINEIQRYLREWVEEQNAIKAHGCSTLIIVLTSTNMNGLGDSVSTTREYYYEAKEKGKRILFVLADSFYIPSSNFIPKDIKDEVLIFGIQAADCKDMLIKKLNLPVPSEQALGPINMTNVEISAPGSMMTLVEASEDAVSIKYDVSQGVGAFSWGVAFWSLDTPMSLSQVQRASFQIHSTDSSIKWARIEFKLINKYLEERVIERECNILASCNAYSIELFEDSNEEMPWYLREICLVLMPYSLSDTNESGVITIQGINFE